MFQNTIVKKYLSKIDDAVIAEKYKTFRAIFANPEKQQNIRDSKEEQYQEGFLRDLFCTVLGYTINPEDGYNLITEKKNDAISDQTGRKIADSRKADGAIIIDGKVKSVIELKGCDTTDLSKIENQAFGYKAHNPGCRYVVISNFEKLRFYVDDASSFLEFNIFSLNRENFALLYLCLALPQITLDIPAHLKSESISEEKSITDKFYGDYSTFKRNLFEDIVENNGTKYDKLVLFKKTQKLLDRLLFILFCEDRGLLPENSILKTIDNWQQLKKLDAYQPLYERYKNYFNRMNTGYKSEDGTMDIFAYNGGLFKPDEILDNITVDDDVLFIYSKLLASYDFVSDVSVDILGHIFEHSLTEIEEIQKEILDTREEILDTKVVGEKNVKLSGFNCLEKGDGFNDGNLSTCQESPERGNVCPLGSNETSSGINSIEHSGRKFQKNTEGFSAFYDDSTRFSNGIGNTASNMLTLELHEKRGNEEAQQLMTEVGKMLSALWKNPNREKRI